MIFAFFRRLFPRPDAVEPEDTEPAAPLSEADKQFQAGLLCACGTGAALDYVKAAGFYEKAAELDHALARYNLAVMYSRGQGVPRDQAKSVSLMQLSAAQGDAGAQYSLGLREHVAARQTDELPKGDSESRIESLKWMRLAAAQGYRDAKAVCDLIVVTMTWDEVAEGNRRADAFVTAHAM